MKTKLLVLLLIFSASMQSQTLESLKTEALKIYESHYYMDFNNTADLTHPKIIETVGKDSFVEKLDTEYQNDDYRKRLQLVAPVFSYSPIKTIDGHAFCIVTYKNPTRYFFEQKIDATTANKKVSELKQSTKANEVIFEPARNSINVKRSSKLIAVSDVDTKNQWKFFNFDDPTQEEQFKNLYTDNIKKQLGF